MEVFQRKYRKKFLFHSECFHNEPRQNKQLNLLFLQRITPVISQTAPLQLVMILMTYHYNTSERTQHNEVLCFAIWRCYIICNILSTIVSHYVVKCVHVTRHVFDHCSGNWNSIPAQGCKISFTFFTLQPRNLFFEYETDDLSKAD